MTTSRADLRLRAFDWLLRRLGRPIGEMSLPQIQQLRATRIPHNAVADLVFGAPAADVAVHDRTIARRAGDIPLRVYQHGMPGDRPLVVFFHGGGWVVGNIYQAEWLCSHVASITGAVVVAAGYRLAPEHRFPTAVDDAYDATAWVAQHAAELGGRADRLAVMGGSAGGNLAALVCQRARDEGGPAIVHQTLLYPATDMRPESRPREDLADAPMLPLVDRKAYLDHYTGGDPDVNDPWLSPLLADSLADLPPALIITAEHDPLRDEGRRYAERLRAAGTPARYTDYAGMVHGFMSYPGLASGARQALAEICQDLVAALR
jgi:acetyl esterase